MPSLETWLKRLPLAELGALVFCALVALLFHARLPSRLPSDADYQQAASALASERAPGDVVFLQPWWTERARLFVPDGLPVVGYLGGYGDALIAHPRIWVLSQPGLPKSDEGAFDEQFLPGRTPLGEARSFGTLRLRLFRNDRHRPVLWSAADAAASARVYIESPQGRLDCPFDGRVHRCPGNLHVAPEWHELFYEPRRCLWIKPAGGASRTVAEFPGVPAGRLSLEGGIIWEHAPVKGVSPLNAGVLDLATGRDVLSLTVPPGLEGVQRVAADAQGGTLKLWVQADSTANRESCFDLFVYGGAP